MKYTGKGIIMTPAERLDAAEIGLDAVIAAGNMSPETVATANALVAIGRLLQNIDNRQAQQAGI